MKQKLFIMGWIFTLFLSSVFAQEEVKDVSQLDISDILNAKVSIAGGSAKGTKINEAPAIVSVITKEDIQKMGALNLYEVLSYVPGINVIETYYGYTDVTFRGNLQTNYNNKSLLLINDHPVYDVVGSFYLEQIPLNMVERVEIIRGPGSTLYGTNAYAGVIKVITKDGKTNKGGNVNLMGGSFGTINPDAYYGKTFGDFSVSTGISVFNTNGYKFNVARDESGRSGTLMYKDNFYNGILSLSYKNIKLNYGYFGNHKDKFGLTPTLATTGERFVSGQFVDLSGDWNIKENLKLNFTGYADIYNKSEYIASYGGAPINQAYSGRKTGLKTQGTYDMNKYLGLTTGIVYEYLHANPYLWTNLTTGAISSGSSWTSSHYSYDISPYIEATSHPFERINLVAGVRYNRNDTYGSATMPRAGMVINIIQDLNLKILYGKAFRNPSFFEKYVSTPNVLFGNASLKPEDINTIDIGFDYMINKMNNVRVNYFYDLTNNLIARTGSVPAGQQGATVNTPQYANSNGQKIQGVEIEFKGNLIEKLGYFANLSYSDGKNRSDNSQVQFIPKYLSNLGANWKTPIKNLEVSPYVQYIGTRSGTLTTTGGGASVTPDYALFNLNIGYTFFENKANVMLIMKNLFGANYELPEYIRAKIAGIPGGPGRAFYLRVGYNF